MFKIWPLCDVTNPQSGAKGSKFVEFQTYDGRTMEKTNNGISLLKIKILRFCSVVTIKNMSSM